MGRVIDPLARDDGETEPELLLEADPSQGEALPETEAARKLETEAPEIERESSPVSIEPEGRSDVDDGLDAIMSGATEAIPSVHPVRARLLARATGHRSPRPAGTEPKSDRSDALLEVGTPSRRFEDADEPPLASAPSPMASLPRPAAQLSPNMIAIFGTLLGLATVASIIALVTRIHPSTKDAEERAPAVASNAAPAAAPAAPKRQRPKVPGPWRIADAKSESGARVIEGKIGTNSFLKALEEAGLEKKEAYRVFNAIKDLRNLDKCDRTDQFAALVDRSSGRLKAFEYIASKEDVIQAREGGDGLLAAKRLDFKIERAQVKGAIVVDGEVDASAEKGGFERGLASTLNKALDGHSSTDELKRGDVVRIVAQEITVLGEFSRYAGIEAIEIRRADDKEKPFRLYYFKGSAERGYFDDKGRAPYEGGWRKPCKDAPITSHFNPKRLHPILKKVMPHTGTDFGAPSGTPVGASSYGTVSFIGPAGPSGNLVKIDHPGGIETGYAHLSKFAEGLSVGDKVKRMQLIGYVGSTGRSTAPHLHFTAKKNGEFFDAETLNLDGMRVISKEERDAFAKAKQQYDELLDSIPLPTPLPSTAPPAREPASADDVGVGSPEPAASGTPAPAPAPTPAEGSKPGNPVYITDKELLKSQAGYDDGEVEE